MYTRNSNFVLKNKNHPLNFCTIDKYILYNDKENGRSLQDRGRAGLAARNYYCYLVPGPISLLLCSPEITCAGQELNSSGCLGKFMAQIASRDVSEGGMNLRNNN